MFDQGRGRVGAGEGLGTWHYLALLFLARIVISAGVGRLGIVALSDDDYSRVTIAEQFALHPRIDPSGTSWLPFPFWVHGGVMKLLDPSLDVARSTATALAIAAVWSMFAAGRIWGFSRGQAFVAALGATLVPEAALLGSLTTPEFSSAALALFSVVVLTASPSNADPDASHQVPLSFRLRALLASLAMFAATLSRYEAWPVALTLAMGMFVGSRDMPRRARIVAGLSLLLGPCCWLLDNWLLHGDPLSFVRRVTSYRAALGGVAPAGYVRVLALSIILAALVLLRTFARRISSRGPSQKALGVLAPWMACALVLSLFLASGEIAGGAPTHHPERALLLVWFLGVFALVHVMRERRSSAWVVAAVGLLLAIDARSLLLERGVDRGAEETVGSRLRSLVAPAERVHVATTDYGYFAVIASFGRPADVIVDATHDPRGPGQHSILDDPSHVLPRLSEERASWLVAPASAMLPFALRSRSRIGDLGIFELDIRR